MVKLLNVHVNPFLFLCEQCAVTLIQRVEHSKNRFCAGNDRCTAADAPLLEYIHGQHPCAVWMLYPVNVATEKKCTSNKHRKRSMCEPGVMRGTLAEYFNLPLCPDPWKNAHVNYVNRTKWYENHLVVCVFFKMELLNTINCIHVLAIMTEAI